MCAPFRPTYLPYSRVGNNKNNNSTTATTEKGCTWRRSLSYAINPTHFFLPPHPLFEPLHPKQPSTTLSLEWGGHFLSNCNRWRNIETYFLEIVLWYSIRFLCSFLLFLISFMSKYEMPTLLGRLSLLFKTTMCSPAFHIRIAIEPDDLGTTQKRSKWCKHFFIFFCVCCFRENRFYFERKK